MSMNPFSILLIKNQVIIYERNTKWQGDESWWISLKEQYDAFFSYDWSVEKLQYSFEHARKDFGKIET